jgi:hypothetical protein
MKLFTFVSLMLCLMALGCSKPTTLVGGVNDFPNPLTSAELGKIITDNLSKGDHWSDSVALPEASSPLALAQSVSVPVIPSSELAKKTATSQTLRFDLSDTAHDVIAVYYSNTSDSVIKNDTLIVLYDDAFRDKIKNNEHLYLIKGSSLNQLTHVRSSYLFVDSDGDSIINNRNGKPNRVFVSSASTGPSGASTRFEIEIDGGADNNLDTKADMRILQCRTLSLSKDGDTVSLADYRSMSVGSILFDASRNDSLLIGVRLIDTDLLLRKTHAEAIFAIFPSDSSKNRAVYFRSEKSLSSGASVKYIVRAQGDDSLIEANDTALATIASAAEGVLDTLRLQVLIGKNPSDTSGNALLGLYNHKINRSGSQRETIISLVCDQPVRKGEALQSGSFSLRIVFDDDQWITAIGSFSPTEIAAKYEDSKSFSRNLTWDRNGKPANE